MTKKILILGGANLHCKLVKAAREMGLYTIVTDYLTDSPAKKIADQSLMFNIYDEDDIVAFCKREKVDAVISTHIDPCQRPYYNICNKLGLPCYIGNWEQVFTLTDKDAFKAACLRNNVDIIPTYDANKPEDIVFPVLVKPAHSRGSRGQTVCNSIAELPKALETARAESSNHNAIIEKYMGNKGDFTMTYIFVNGVPHLTKTSDRNLGDLELGLEKVGIGTISPSFYADMYKRNVQERILNMLRDLNIQNGPVFMQGFVDDDTVRFYDPGYRFPGSEYDTMFSRIWDMDIMKMMVEFALTGKMDNQYCKLLPDMSELKGHSVITLFPAMKEGHIAAIEGLDAIAAMPEVIGYTLRHNVGENVPFTRNVNQRFGEFDVIAEDYAALKKLIAKILSTLHVKDPSGNELLYGNIDVDKLP